MRRAFDWAFRSRETGRITIAQFPNAPLIAFMVFAALDRIVRPAGVAGQAVGFLATACLLVWAFDELVRGVNPFRRVLGLGVIAHEAVTLLG